MRWDDDFHSFNGGDETPMNTMPLWRRKPLVLIVDDDTDTCEMFRTAFFAEGYHAIPATTREDAVAVFSAVRPDLIMTDIRMGEMTLQEFSAHVSRFNSRPPIILLSAAMPEELEFAA